MCQRLRGLSVLGSISAKELKGLSVFLSGVQVCLSHFDDMIMFFISFISGIFSTHSSKEVLGTSRDNKGGSYDN